MNRFFICGLSTALLALLILPAAVLPSGDVNGCHCFRNRTFNPDDKFASDDYLLTTTFNSLLASEFSISKRQIIMMKMREGIANNDLVTALYLARETQLALPDLLRLRKQKSWQEIITPIQAMANESTAKKFQFINPGVTDDEISGHITNLMISSRFAPAADSLELLRQDKLTHREIILACTLADHTGVAVQDIVDKFRKSGLSWSEIAHNFGMEPADVGKLLEKGKEKTK